MGQIVQTVKPIVSNDFAAARCENHGMVKDNEEAAWTDAYIARVKELRVSSGKTAEEMASLLRIPPDRYRKYESRSPLPTYLLERFCLIVGRDISYVVTGKNNVRNTSPSPRLVARK